MIVQLTLALICSAAALAPQDAGPVPDDTQAIGPEEMLVEAIKENLNQIDELLMETADAEEDVAGGLERVRKTHMDVIRDLEELIKQAKYRKSNQSNGGGGGSDQPMPQNQPPPRESDGSRKPDSAPDPQSGQQPSDGSDEQQQQQQQQGQRPEDGALDDGTAKQDMADGEPPPDPLAPFTREDTDGRWGLLPPKLQERLMNLHVDDVPEQYRAWMTAYIRSMQRLESAGAGGGR